jgi:hypothetical protein
MQTATKSILESEFCQPSSPLNLLNLQTVSAKFEEWRSFKKNNNLVQARIPKELWQQVIELFGRYPLTKIRKTLKLDIKQLNSKLKQYRNQTSAKTIKPKQPTFIPINVPHHHQSEETNVIGKIELKRSDGAIISIERLNQHTFLSVLTQFMRGV